jgi:hypothetical protein
MWTIVRHELRFVRLGGQKGTHAFSVMQLVLPGSCDAA